MIIRKDLGKNFNRYFALGLSYSLVLDSPITLFSGSFTGLTVIVEEIEFVLIHGNDFELLLKSRRMQKISLAIFNLVNNFLLEVQRKHILINELINSFSNLVHGPKSKLSMNSFIRPSFYKVLSTIILVKTFDQSISIFFV